MSPDVSKALSIFDGRRAHEVERFTGDRLPVVRFTVRLTIEVRVCLCVCLSQRTGEILEDAGRMALRRGVDAKKSDNGERARDNGTCLHRRFLAYWLWQARVQLMNTVFPARYPPWSRASGQAFRKEDG